MDGYRSQTFWSEFGMFWVNFYRFVFTDTKMIMALNTTNRCNLKCTHCYWWREEHPSQLDDDAMIELMKSHRKAGKNIALLYGGEPALRPNIIRAASKMFEATVVYTNGTVGFPDIPVTWMLSLDGTREIHDKIRGKGVFDKVMKNLERDTFRKPVVHCTITRQNQHIIEDMIQMVAANPRLRGIGFSFYTPELGKHDNGIFIPLEERDQIVDQLVALSKKYWRTMGFNKGMANQFRTTGAFPKWNSLEKCTVTKMVDCMNADGTPITCIYGNNADCSRCGCTGIAVYRAAFKSWNPMSLLTAAAIVASQKEEPVPKALPSGQ